MQARPTQLIPVVDEKVSVLEVAQQPEVGCDAEGEKPFAPNWVGTMNTVARNRVVEADREDDDPEVGRLPPGVKEQRSQQQPPQSQPLIPSPADQEIQQQRDRQKYEDELVRIKQHRNGRFRVDVTRFSWAPSPTAGPGERIEDSRQEAYLRAVRTTRHAHCFPDGYVPPPTSPTVAARRRSDRLWLRHSGRGPHGATGCVSGMVEQDGGLFRSDRRF